MPPTYATCVMCGAPIVKPSNGRWVHCSNTSRWCNPDADPTDDTEPVAEPE